MLGQSITPEPGPGPAAGFIPPADGSSAFLPQWPMAANPPVKQPARDYGVEVRIPQPDRISRALLDAIF